MDFAVTADVIEASVRRDSSHCMIAEALKAAYPSATFVSVDLATIRFSDPATGLRYIYLTPRAAQEALIRFDQGEKPEPFRIRGRAAQILPTGAARRNHDNRRTVQPARTDGADGAPPTVIGGHQLPVGQLADPPKKTKGVQRTSQRREFGLRRLIK